MAISGLKTLNFAESGQSLIHLTISCSIILLALRGLIQLGLFTSQIGILDALQLFEGPFVSMLILGSNILCMGLHCFLDGPSINDNLSRGYVHGGILIDFVGMKAPISKVPLLGFDFLVLMFQLMMLSTTIEKLRVREAQSSASSLRVSSTTRPQSDTAPPGDEQTLDHEERGIFHSQEDQPSSPLSSPPSNHPTFLSPLLSSEPPLAPATQPSSSPNADFENDPDRVYYMNEYQHPAEAFYSGEHVVLDINILRVIRDQRRSRRPSPTNSVPPSSSSLSPEARILLAAAAATRADMERGRTRQGGGTRTNSIDPS